MRAALVQVNPILFERERNLERAGLQIAAVPADLYVLPELFSSGYTFARLEEVARMAEPSGDGPTFAWAHELARRHNAHLAYGFPEVERREGQPPRYFNAASIVGPRGLVVTYRKIHVFGRETLFFARGEAPPPVVDLPCGRCGLMICFDWYFPEVARSLALRGAQVLVHPSNLVLPHCPEAMKTRALENRVFALTCDRVGEEANGDVVHRFIGSSQAVSPQGEMLCRLSTSQEEIAAVELDPGQADEKRVAGYNDLFGDRRPALYSGLC